MNSSGARMGAIMPYCGKDTYNLIIAALLSVDANLNVAGIKDSHTNLNITPYRLARIKVTNPNQFSFSISYSSGDNYIILSVREDNNIIMVTFYIEEFGYYLEYKGRLEDPDFLVGLVVAFDRYLTGLRDIYNCIIVKFRPEADND